ncbi:MAG: nicotinate-nucleotide--dimethylbenzimidazole phosphoribosyltransferase [Clostridiales bacterium]|nr:nicotinate-nucleotide--dimethylbenzimidazole phosphoribosyltransferase [Clostridiales bacterium]
MNLHNLISSIKPVNTEAAKACEARFNNVAKPIGSLGKLESLVMQIASVTGSAEVSLNRKAVVVFCADNGVAQSGASLYGHEVTTAIAKLLALGKSSVSVMAESCEAQVFPVDIGMVDTVNGLRSCKLMSGTNNIAKEAAMSAETAEKAIITGINTVKELKEKGYNIIATGETGMGNTTTSSAVCSVLLGRPAREVTGRGAGLDDAGLLRKIAAIEQAIEVNKPDADSPMDVLHKVGGLDIAAMAGLFLGGAIYNVPIVMDGFISGAAALIAVRLCPLSRGYILPSHKSFEPGARIILEELNFSPVIDADMRLGEGTGAAALFPLLDMALAVYNNAATYDDIQVGN